jgi:hypothetical protein
VGILWGTFPNFVKQLAQVYEKEVDSYTMSLKQIVNEVSATEGIHKSYIHDYNNFKFEPSTKLNKS